MQQRLLAGLPVLRSGDWHAVPATLQNDIIAGLSVGAMVIPQGMSYASLAGLPYGAPPRAGRCLRGHSAACCRCCPRTAAITPSACRCAPRCGCAVYGLYGAFVPCLVYAFLGSSRQLAVGPVAVTSTLLGNGLAGLFPGLADSSACGTRGRRPAGRRHRSARP